MKLPLQPGTYVAAVSGGVDSMVLLDILRHQSGIKLVVAHFDHGIRTDSRRDRQLVEKVARQHGLPFVFDQVKLGPGTSEATARTARYDFLQKVRQASQARAIITAHHQDDLLETAFLNALRGSGRRGLTALDSRPTLHRPLLQVPKAKLRQYANTHKLAWREDSTNFNDTYLRNRLRLYILPLLSQAERHQLVDDLSELKTFNYAIDRVLANYLHLQLQSGTLDRQSFIRLPHQLAREVMAFWLRAHQIQGLTTSRLEILTTKAKVLPAGKQLSVDRQHVLQIKPHSLVLKR